MLTRELLLVLLIIGLALGKNEVSKKKRKEKERKTGKTVSHTASGDINVKIR